MNTIESTLWHVKAFLNSYNLIYHPALNKLAAGCRSVNVNKFRIFVGIVASMELNI
jgi:hypothetical protein